MTIKTALSAIALSAGLLATPAFAQGMMIGTQTVAEADAEAEFEISELFDDIGGASDEDDAEDR